MTDPTEKSLRALISILTMNSWLIWRNRPRFVILIWSWSLPGRKEVQEPAFSYWYS